MGQIHGDNLGSPAVIVTSLGELLVTGSVIKTAEEQTNDILVGRDSEQLLASLLKEAKKINFQLSIMTDNIINNQDVEV